MNEYNGITLNNGTYKVQLSRKGRTFYLGNYPTAVQAAMGYDRAVHLSAAWSTKRHNLNFPDNPKPSDESTFTEFEKQMLTHLRTYFPEAEKDAKNKKLVDLETPDVLLRDFQNVRDRKDAFVNTMVETLASAESTILRMASALADLKQSKQFYVDKLAEAEVTISRLRGIKHEDGKPKFKITPITPEKIEADRAKAAAALAKQVLETPAGKALVADINAEIRTALAVPETPASPVPTVFVETAPMTHEPVLAPAIEALRQIVLEPAEEGQAVQSSGVMEAAEIESVSSESEKEDDPEPIYPVVPGAKNPPQNGDEESGENAGFSKE